jgi:hypothetical protein
MTVWSIDSVADANCRGDSDPCEAALAIHFQGDDSGYPRVTVEYASAAMASGGHARDAVAKYLDDAVLPRYLYVDREGEISARYD